MNPVVKLCIAGTQAEFEGRHDEACQLYRRAWERAVSGYERCIAAHYLARCQDEPQQRLYWNLTALKAADEIVENAAGSDGTTTEPAGVVADVRSFYPSLYVNLGASYEALGDQVEAQRYYELAAGLGLLHDAG